MNCPHCNTEMDNWYYARFSGSGPWKDKPWPCKKCGLLKDGSKPKEIKDDDTKGPFVRIQEPNGMRSY